MTVNTMCVLVKCIRVHNYGNGLVGLEFPVEPMTDADRDTIYRLLPDLQDWFYELLESPGVETIETWKGPGDNPSTKRPNGKKPANPAYDDYKEEIKRSY